eukprot:gene3213-2195_t
MQCVPYTKSISSIIYQYSKLSDLTTPPKHVNNQQHATPKLNTCKVKSSSQPHCKSHQHSLLPFGHPRPQVSNFTQIITSLYPNHKSRQATTSVRNPQNKAKSSH